MLVSDVQADFVALDHQVSIGDYNYTHFRPIHGLRHVRRTLEWRGILPGKLAPDFEMPSSEGVPTRLSNLRGRPVLLTFSSYT